MPRSPGGTIKSRTQPVTRLAPPPAPSPPVARLPEPQSKPTFSQTVMEGVSFGAGSAIGHRVVNGIFGLFGTSEAAAPTPDREFQQCLADHQEVMDAVTFCRQYLNPQSVTGDYGSSS